MYRTEERINYFRRERDEHVSCHAEALALAMTDKACGEEQRCMLVEFHHFYKRHQKSYVFLLSFLQLKETIQVEVDF